MTTLSLRGGSGILCHEERILSHNHTLSKVRDLNTFVLALDVNGTGMLLTLIVTFRCHKMCNLAETMIATRQNLFKFCALVLKILSGNRILTSIKGHNSVANLQNLTLHNPTLDTCIINVNVYTKFG